MKIAILQDDFPPRHIGGAGTIAFATANALVKQGHDVIVITTERHSELAGMREHGGLRVYAIATDYDFRFQAYVSLWNIPVVREVKKILVGFKPDVVHAHRVHGYLSYGSLVVAKRLGAKVFLTVHDVMPFNYGKLVETIDPTDMSIPEKFNWRVSAFRQFRDSRLRYNPIRNVVIRYILSRYVDRVLAVSEALKDALEQNGIGNVAVIHNGVELSRVEERTVKGFKEKHAIGNHAVFFTGKPIGVKGALKLLEALAVVSKQIPDVQLMVVGREDDQTKRLLRHAKNLGLEEKIIVTGWLVGRDLHAAYASSALVVVPTLSFDSFPTVNLEAMAAKKPVIATCFGGSREAVEDGVSGYIVNPFDVFVLAEKTGELLRNSARAHEMGARGYERAQNIFTLEKQVEAFERYYLN